MWMLLFVFLNEEETMDFGVLALIVLVPVLLFVGIFIFLFSRK